MMAFDHGSAAGTGFDHVGVDGSLQQKLGAAYLFRLPLEHADEALADYLALFFGLGDSRELREEVFLRVDLDDVETHILAVEVHDLIRLVLAEQAVIDEYAGEAVADGAGYERGCDGGIDPAGEPRDDAAGTDLLFDVFDELFNETLGAPAPLAAADPVGEVLEEAGAVFRVRDLRMELHGIETLFAVLHRGDGAFRRMGYDGEALRRLCHHIVMAHPDGGVRHPLKEGGGLEKRLNTGVFAHGRLLDPAAQHMGHELHAVADAEHRHAEPEDRGIAFPAVLGIDAVRAAGEYHAREPVAKYPLDGGIGREKLGKDALLAHPAGDELVILGAEVQNDYSFHWFSFPVLIG